MLINKSAYQDTNVIMQLYGWLVVLVMQDGTLVWRPLCLKIHPSLMFILVFYNLKEGELKLLSRLMLASMIPHITSVILMIQARWNSEQQVIISGISQKQVFIESLLMLLI